MLEITALIELQSTLRNWQALPWKFFQSSETIPPVGPSHSVIRIDLERDVV